MKCESKVLRIFAPVALLLLICPAVPAQTLRLPPHEKVVLKNGLTVLLMEKRGVPLIDVFALVKTGAAADPAGEAGLASVTAALLRKGNKDAHGAAVCRGPGLHRRFLRGGRRRGL